MSNVLFFYPDMDGYSENYEWPRSMFYSDSGKTHFVNKQDPYNESTEMPQFPAITVNASYTFTDIKQVRMFENIVTWAKGRYIFMPIWFGVMKIKTLVNATTLELEQLNPNGGSSSIKHTAWDGTMFPTATSSTTFAQTGISALRISASNNYTYTFSGNVSSINNNVDYLVFSSAYPSGSVVGDLIVPCMTGYIENVDFDYSMNGPQLLTASVTVRQS